MIRAAKLAWVAVFCLSLGQVTLVASAASVTLDTGEAPYSIVAGPLTTGPFVVTHHSAWLPAASVGDGTADWISPAASATTAVPEGYYHYQLALALASGDWGFDAHYSSDNIVTEIYLLAADSSRTDLIPPLGPGDYGTSYPNADRQFEVVVPVSKEVDNLAGSFTLNFIVYNTEGYGNSPSGLIVEGEATQLTGHPLTIAPLPAPALAGLVLLAGLGGGSLIRRIRTR